MPASRDKLIAARILLVDDDETNVRLLSRILEQKGYTSVRSTTEGTAVAAIVRDFDPDRVLLDLHMPPPDGFEILSQLSPLIGGPKRLPVLVLTGDDAPETKRRALSLGARDRT